MFQRFQERKKDGPRELPCLFRWRRPPPVASIAKAPKGRRTAISPPMTFYQNVKTALQEPRKRARDGNRTEMREPHAPREMQDESRKPVLATFCRPPRNAVRPEPSLASAPQGEWLAKKDKRGLHAGGLHPERKKPSEAPFFPLSAPAETALRQKSFVFAEGGSFLCGKRFCFYCEKTTAGTEKCSIQTVSPPAF